MIAFLYFSPQLTRSRNSLMYFRASILLLILILMFVQWAKHAACVGWWSTHGVSGRPHARKELDEFITRTEMARANIIFSSAASAKAGRKFYAPVSFCFGNEFMKCILIWIVSGIENRWDIHKHERTKEQKLLELLGALLGHLKERHFYILKEIS